MFKQLLFYGGVITLFGPLFAWLFLVLPS